MPDTIESLHEGFTESGVYDASDDGATRIQKAAAFLSRAPNMSAAKKEWILRGIQTKASRESYSADIGEQRQRQIERGARIAEDQSGLDATANLPAGLGYPSLILDRASRSMLSGVDHAIGGVADVVAGPDNRVSKFVKEDAEEAMAPDSRLNSTLQKVADIAGNLLPMMSPLGAATVGGGQGAATALDAGASRGAGALAGLITGAAGAVLPGILSPRIQAAAAPATSQIANPLIRTVVDDVIQGTGVGAGLGVGNAIGQIPTAVDTRSLDPLIEQAKAIPEMALLGGVMHPFIRGTSRIGERDTLNRKMAEEQAVRDAEQQASTAATAEARAKFEQQSGIHRSAIEKTIGEMGERVGISRDEAMADLNARALEYQGSGMPEMASRVKAAQEVAANLRQFADNPVQLNRGIQEASQRQLAEQEALPPSIAPEKPAAQSKLDLEIAKRSETAERDVGEMENTELAQSPVRMPQEVTNAPINSDVSKPAPALAREAIAPEIQAYHEAVAKLPPEIANHPAVKSTIHEIGDGASDPQGALGNLQQAVQIAQARPRQSAAPAPASAAAIEIARGQKGVLISNGRDLFVNGNKVGPDSPALRASLTKALGVLQRPKAEARSETAPVPEIAAPKSPERLAWEAEKAKLPDEAPPVLQDSGESFGTTERPRSRDAYRAGISRRGSFDPVRTLTDAYDAGARGLGEIVNATKTALGRFPTEPELQALRTKYNTMMAESKSISQSGFWKKVDDRLRDTLSMEMVAARYPEVRRVVGVVQRIRAAESIVVSEHMREANPFVNVTAADRAVLSKAAFHFTFENPRGKLDLVMADGTRLTPEQQKALQSAFDATRKSTEQFVADMDRAKGLSEEAAKFRDIMKNLISDPGNRYIPMRRFGNERLFGKASTQDVLNRLTNKGRLSGEEATVLRLAKMAALKGEKDFTYYYAAGESNAAMRKIYETEAHKYEAAAGAKLERTTYDPAFDRAKSLGISHEQVVRLATQAGLQPQAILDMMSALPMRGHKSSAIEARGIPGASSDHARSLGQWFSHMASMRANAAEARNLAEAVEGVKDPHQRQRVDGYLALQKQPVNSAATTGKAFLHLFSMGLRPASAMAEGAGGIIMAPAKLFAIGMPREAARAFGEMASTNVLNLWRLAHLGKQSMLDVAKSKLSGQMAVDMQRSADTGRFGNQVFRDEMQAQSKSVMQDLTEKAMFLHRNLREANAIGVWQAAYKAASSGVLPPHTIKALEMQGIDVGARTPREVADAVTDFTMNRVDKTTMPMWQSATPVGQIAGTLTSYQTRSLAQMIDIARVWKNMPQTRAYGVGAAATLVAMFGAGALPFGNWVMKAAEILDDDPRHMETRALSDRTTEAALYGLSGIAAEQVAKGMGADDATARAVANRFDAFSRRISWGNFLNTSGTSLLDQLPVVSLMSSIGRSASQGWEGVERGDWWTAAEGAAGTVSLAARDAVKGARATLTGKIVNSAGDTVSTDASPIQGLSQVAGFGMSDTQVAGADSSTRMAINNARKNALKRFAYRFANADGDVSDIMEDINAWNARYLARNDAIGWAMVLDGPSLDNAIKRAMTREMLGAHDNAVMQAKGAEQLVLQENAP